MNKLLKITVSLLIIFTIVLQGASIFITNTKATDGVSAGKLANELEELKIENMELESKMLTLASFKNVASKAAELGYSDNQDFVSLFDPVEVALSR